MELFVATWALRVSVIAALAVGGVSYYSGTPAMESVDRALVVAVGFTFAARFLMGWLEPPERKMLRLRRRREQARAKAIRAGARSAAGRAPRAQSTLNRSA